MMSRPYKAKFRILLKDRYAQSVGFWGAKYRIVYSDGGEAPLITNKAASKDGYTVLIESKKPMKFRLELLNLSEGENIYEIPTYNVANSEIETTLNTNIRSVQVEKGFFQMKIEDPFGNKLDKNKFEYKIISKEKDKNGNLLILKDWSNLKEPGYTHILSIKKGLINFDSSIDVFRSLFYTRPYVDIFLRHKATKVETRKEERLIAFGSDKSIRQWKLDENSLSAITKPKDQKSIALVNELKFSRDIKVLFSLEKGRTYIAKREDKGSLFTHALKESSFINWQDGQQISFKVPARYRGKIIITAKDGVDNGKIIETINIGALDSKNYKSTEKPLEIKIIKQPLVDGGKTKKQEFNDNEYVQYCIDMGYVGANKKFNLEDLKDPKKCTDREFKGIWQSLKSTFSFDNSATWWNVSAGVIASSLDVSKRVSIVDKFFKPFFNVMGVAASQAIFIIKNLGNHNGLFFIGAIRGRAYFHLAKFAKSSKDILIQRLPREHVFDFSPKGTVKGSLIGLIVGGGIELRNWLGQEKNQRDVTDLLGNLTGMAIKTIIGTWIGVILVSMIIGGGPIGVIIAVGLVVGIGVAWVLDALDEIFNITGSIRDLYNHLQSCTQNTIFEMVNNGNKLLGFNYTLPSWLF